MIDHDRVYKYLNQCPPSVSGQHGHDQTFKVAVVLVWGFCLPRDEALEYLRDYNSRCLPPWTEPELEHKIDSAIETCNRLWLAGDSTYSLRPASEGLHADGWRERYIPRELGMIVQPTKPSGFISSIERRILFRHAEKACLNCFACVETCACFEANVLDCAVRPGTNQTG